MLERALKSDPDDACEIHWLAASAYQNGTPPDLKKATEHIDAYLLDPKLTHEETYQGQLAKGQILFKNGQKGDCVKLLRSIPQDASAFTDAIVLRGQLANAGG